MNAPASTATLMGRSNAVPSATAAPAVLRDGPALAFSGAIDRDACARLWAQASAQTVGVERVDLTAVTGVDSAGLALLAEVVDRIHPRPNVLLPEGAAGLTELRAAYRLDSGLAFVV